MFLLLLLLRRTSDLIYSENVPKNESGVVLRVFFPDQRSHNV